MKYNLPYLINLPPFFIKDIDVSDLKGVKKLSLILRGKILAFFIKILDKKIFCIFINTFFRSDGKINFDNGKYVKSTKNGLKIYFPNKRILRIVKNYKNNFDRIFYSYCLNEIDFNQGDVIIDCGSNIGELKYALNQNNIDTSYVAFEPDPKTFDCLNLNHSSESLHLFNYALSNKEGSLKFFLDNEGGNSSLSNFGSSDFIEVKSKTLDSMNFNFNCKLFKVEAEGHEPEVIEGSLETLKRTEYVTIDYGFERGVEQENTMVACNKMLYENEFKLVAFSEYRLIGLYKNSKYEND